VPAENLAWPKFSVPPENSTPSKITGLPKNSALV
jgi:hypothetical protein